MADCFYYPQTFLAGALLGGISVLYIIYRCFLVVIWMVEKYAINMLISILIYLTYSISISGMRGRIQNATYKFLSSALNSLLNMNVTNMLPESSLQVLIGYSNFVADEFNSLADALMRGFM